jgi:hypothetical protein
MKRNSGGSSDMGHKERVNAAINAEEKGRSAFLDGQGQEDNPYKNSPWGLYTYWNMGWQREKQGYYQLMESIEESD